jgi:hypothetical protein
MAASQVQLRQAEFEALRKAYEEGWARLTREVREANQTLDPLASL